jgi:hypothetical protein
MRVGVSAGHQHATIDQQRGPIALLDETPPAVAAVTAPASIPGLSSPSFQASVHDNVDLVEVTPFLTFSGGLAFEQPRVTVGAYGFADGLVADANVAVQVSGFIRSWQNTGTSNRVSGAVSVAAEAAFEGRDAAGNGAAGSASILAAVLTGAGGSIPSLATLAPAAFTPVNPLHGQFVEQTPSNTKICNATAGCTSPMSTTVSATMTGPNATFVNPFNRVEFYFGDPTSGRWRRIGNGSVSVTDDTVLGTRTYRYTATWTPAGVRGSNGTPLLGTIPTIAVGIHPSGSALIAGNTLRAVTLSTS